MPQLLGSSRKKSNVLVVIIRITQDEFRLLEKRIIALCLTQQSKV